MYGIQQPADGSAAPIVLCVSQTRTDAALLRAFHNVGESLVSLGCRVIMAARDVNTAIKMSQGAPIEWLQAPVTPSDGPRKLRPPITFAHLVYACGFEDEIGAATMIAGWRGLLESVKPGVLLLDHSPMAHVAARCAKVKSIVMGTGLYCPEAVAPQPNLTPWHPLRTMDAASFESKLVDQLNRHLHAAGAAPIHRLADLYAEADARLLLTYPELDPIERWTPNTYWGVATSQKAGAPRWPAHAKEPKALVLLRPQRGLDEQITAIAGTGVCMATMTGADAVAVHREGGRATTVTNNDDLDVGAAISACDVCISDGAHEIVACGLVHAKPHLVIPSGLEQHLLAGKLEQLGVGLMANPSEPLEIRSRLRQLIDDPMFKTSATTAAQSLQQRFSHTPAQQVAEEIHKVILSDRTTE